MLYLAAVSFLHSGIFINIKRSIYTARAYHLEQNVDFRQRAHSIGQDHNGTQLYREGTRRTVN